VIDLHEEAAADHLWWLLAIALLLPLSNVNAAAITSPETKASATLCDGSSLSADWKVEPPKSGKDGKKTSSKRTQARDKQPDTSGNNKPAGANTAFARP
jgi:hypothetical protein